MADQTLASMSAASTLDGTEIVYGNQSSGNVKITTAQIVSLVPTATTSNLGLVEPDGSTITISDGVISSTGGGGGLTGFDGSVNSTPPNDTVNVSILTTDAETTNQDITLLPTGTGAFQLLVPDGTSTGGNKRGGGAVDLQTSINKGSATTVANGLFAYCEGNGNTASSIAAHAEGTNTIASVLASHAEGHSTTASGIAAHAEGLNSAASADYAHAEGFETTASGQYSHSEGWLSQATNQASHAEGDQTTASGNCSHSEGSFTIADAQASHASGEKSWTRGVICAEAWSSGSFSTNGDQQCMRVGLKGQTTDATPLVLTADGNAVANSNQLVLVDNETAFVDVFVLGKVAGQSDCIAIQLQALIQRGTGAASTAIPTTTTASPAVISTYATAGAISGTWGVALSADTTNGALSVTVTGADATTINWTAELRSRELVS